MKLDPALQSYLKRYENSGGSGAPGAGSDPAKKKRKRKRGAAAALAGVRIVDESVSGFLSGPAADDEEPEEEDADGYGVPLCYCQSQAVLRLTVSDPQGCETLKPTSAGLQSLMWTQTSATMSCASLGQARVQRLLDCWHVTRWQHSKASPRSPLGALCFSQPGKWNIF